jgi:uncharacterized protein (TIGR02271 family)
MAKDYDMDEQAREINRQRPSDNPQVAALKDLGDYEVAEGYPDPRGWTVRSTDGTDVGKVHDLIVDTGTMRTRYLAVRLDDDFAGSRNDRDVMIPIGTARIDDDGDNVIVDNLSADRFATLPAYEPSSLTRDQEQELRTHFSSGDAMSAGTIGAGAAGGSDFYDHDHFDDRNFFARGREQGVRNEEDEIARARMEEADRLTISEERLDVGKRQVQAGEVGVRKNVETRHVEQEVPIMREEVSVERRPLNADAGTAGDIRISDGEIRVPVMREEAVVEKRLVPTEEIIIRKTAVRDTETVGADLRRERVEVDKNSTDRVRDTLDEDRRDLR